MKKIIILFFMLVLFIFGNGLVLVQGVDIIGYSEASVVDGKLVVAENDYFTFDSFFYYNSKHEDSYISTKMDVIQNSTKILYCILEESCSINLFDGKVYFILDDSTDINVLNFTLNKNEMESLQILDIDEENTIRYLEISSYIDYKIMSNSELEVIDLSAVNTYSPFLISPDIHFQDPDDLPGGGGNVDNTSFTYSSTLTMTDSVLNSYNPEGDSSYKSDGGRKDDDIIKLIPKDCFENRAMYYYFGKEYGFFITTYEYGNNNKSVVLILDFNTVAPGTGTVKCDCTFTVTPLIQYVYEYCSDSSLVLPVREETHYNIKNVGIAFNIQNKSIPNYGDSNYDVYSDYGDYIVSSLYNYSGSGSIIPSNSFYYDMVQFAFGFIPALDDVSSISEFAWNIISNGNSGYFEIKDVGREQSTPLYYNNSFEVDFLTHIKTYNGLIKSLNVRPINQDGLVENPVIFGTKTGVDFISATIKINNYGGSEKNVYSELYLGINVDVIYDNSYYNGNNPVNKYSAILLNAGNAFYYGDYKAY